MVFEKSVQPKDETQAKAWALFEVESLAKLSES